MFKHDTSQEQRKRLDFQIVVVDRLKSDNLFEMEVVLPPVHKDCPILKTLVTLKDCPIVLTSPKIDFYVTLPLRTSKIIP